MSKYFWNLLIAIDQLGNAILAGDPDETISSRMGKWSSRQKSGWRRKVGRTVCWFLNKIDKNHCAESIEHDEGDDAALH